MRRSMQSGAPPIQRGPSPIQHGPPPVHHGPLPQRRGNSGQLFSGNPQPSSQFYYENDQRSEYYQEEYNQDTRYDNWDNNYPIYPNSQERQEDHPFSGLPKAGEGSYLPSGSQGRRRGPKKPVDVDKKGIPYGKMVAPFVADIQSLARDLDPSLGYANQKEDARIRLRERLEEEWEFYSDSKTVSEAYIKKKAGRTLIKYRHELNKLIDQGKNKPMDVLKEYWDELVKTRGTPKARARSQLMRGHCHWSGFERKHSESCGEKTNSEACKYLQSSVGG
jgi:hypothetical protein